MIQLMAKAFGKNGALVPAGTATAIEERGLLLVITITARAYSGEKELDEFKEHKEV